ncbi:MAG: serine acetyltransferase [Planctomycetes bacterium]|nr:serine acetyltransferase [Planctomycetota bacterium]MBI3836097.1 serine acetyltransferase [Planctomycetota bacterium]
MPEDFIIGAKLGALVERMVASYRCDARTQHIDRVYLPNRGEIIQLVRDLLELLYPGFIGRQHLTQHNVAFHVGDLLPRIGEAAFRQIYLCQCYADEDAKSNHPSSAERPSEQRARELTLSFLENLPAIREILATDVQAAFDGDPAALNCDEVILAYPGLLAISVQRLAHALYQRGVPLMPRIMSEWVHSQTGIDIHPGAKIGRSFFIDHGTGVVIGETAEIGANVKVYQGVTLGALSIPKDERGRVIRATKRHPTVRDNVTIYANAIILGGETVIGEGSTIGGSVFVTSSVPPNSVVSFTPPELRLKTKGGTDGRAVSTPETVATRRTARPNTDDAEIMPDYSI